MKNILMYSSSYCPFCTNAERLLEDKGFDVTQKVLIDKDPNELKKMMKLTGKRTVPQIFIDNTYIGGFDELRAADLSGELDKLLK